MGKTLIVFFSLLPLTAHADDYTRTQYPIVLAHGMGGFTQLFGVVSYFYDIDTALADGGAEVYVTNVSPFSDSEARGEQLLAQVQYILATSGAAKVNLIGHSQGGLDVRYVASVRPDLVASVSTVSSPHKGAGLADWLRAHLTDGSLSEDVIAFFANSLGTVLDLLCGTSDPQNAVAGLDQLTTDGTAAFTAKYPEGVPAGDCSDGEHKASNGVRYYSWAGSSVLTNFIDPSDAPLGLASLAGNSDNDGLVSKCSAHLGKVIRDDYDWNHLDEVNQVLGLTSLFASDPSSVFRAHANRLKGVGL